MVLKVVDVSSLLKLPINHLLSSISLGRLYQFLTGITDIVTTNHVCIVKFTLFALSSKCAGPLCGVALQIAVFHHLFPIQVTDEKNFIFDV